MNMLGAPKYTVNKGVEPKYREVVFDPMKV
jgi:hypothetical protein